MSATMTAAPLDTDLARLRFEFMSFPGMCLTVEQVARLLDAPCDQAVQALSVLEAEGLLLRWGNTYRRASPLLS